MFKNQLQELAQRSCFNLPSYACIREGPDHAPRFKASVNFNGEIFESPVYSTTLRQAEHAAAEVALNSLSARGPSKSLTARVLDETGVYKNLLQETAHRAGLKLPIYTTVRSGPGHVPVFTSTVEIAGISFAGEAAKTKKQAEKNAAISAWSSFKTMPNLGPLDHNHHHHHQRRDESRVIRRRDQYQSRGRMHKGGGGGGGQREISFGQKQPWKKLMDDTNLEMCPQNYNNFLSLLPPPPPRTTPKILPPNLYPPTKIIRLPHSPQDNIDNIISEAIEKPVEALKGWNQPPHYNQNARMKTEVDDDDYEWINKISEAIKKPAGHFHAYNEKPPIKDSKLLEDDDEWINKISEAIKKPCSSTASSTSHIYPLHHNQTGGKIPPMKNSKLLEHDNEWISNKISEAIDFTKPSKIANSNPFKIQSSYCSPSFNGRQRIAPAVQIRSVIPVCAAPPPPPKDATPAPPPTAELATSMSKLKL